MKALASVPRKLMSSEVRVVMQRFMETSYGIYNHNTPKRHPLDMVLMHPAECATSISLLFERMEKFELLEVGKRFNISWDKFKELPTYEADFMLQLAAERMKSKNKAEEEVANSMENSLKNLSSGSN